MTYENNEENVRSLNDDNGKVMVCTWSSAHWQQASKLSALWCFELTWKYWDNAPINIVIIIIIIITQQYQMTNDDDAGYTSFHNVCRVK